MLLSAQDIARLEKKGYKKDMFVRQDNQGFSMLRNRQGSCVFYNVKERKCDVYTVRPEGCRIYPVILDEEKGIVVDSICHAQASISEQEKKRRGKLVINLLKKIDEEVLIRKKR